MIKPSIPLEDVWSPGTLTPLKMRAYKLLESQGHIKLQQVYYSRSTHITRVVYQSVVEQSKTHQRLRGACTELERSEREEQLTFEKPILYKPVEVMSHAR
jgi:hypothetical protein